MAIKNQDTSITNVHGDHVASCLCCAKFSGSMGESDWSDVTPGSPGSIDCDDGEFSFGENDGFGEILEVIHNTARHCKLFIQRNEGAS